MFLVASCGFIPFVRYEFITNLLLADTDHKVLNLMNKFTNTTRWLK